MHRFNATIEIIGVNPFVFVPETILHDLFEQSGRHKGHIPVHGTINGNSYKQTLVRYGGHWRLYINTRMLTKSPQRIGEQINITIAFDPEERSVAIHPKLTKALKANKAAKNVFDNLPPSRQKEIVRYIASLKTVESVDRNVQRAINFLCGKGRFVGRDHP